MSKVSFSPAFCNLSSTVFPKERKRVFGERPVCVLAEYVSDAVLRVALRKISSVRICESLERQFPFLGNGFSSLGIQIGRHAACDQVSIPDLVILGPDSDLPMDEAYPDGLPTLLVVGPPIANAFSGPTIFVEIWETDEVDTDSGVALFLTRNSRGGDIGLLVDRAIAVSFLLGARTVCRQAAFSTLVSRG